MHAHEHVLPVAHVAVHQRHVLRRIDVVPVGDDPELAVRRGEPRLRDAMDQPLMGEPVGDELRHRDEGETVRRREPLEVGPARHRAVGVQDLADHAGRIQPGQASEVQARLGLADALQHPAGPRPQREHVSGSPQVARHRGRIDRDLDGDGAIAGGNARRHAEARRRVDRDRERRLVRLGVVLGHLGQPQGLATLGHEREADQAPGVRRHEIDRLGGDLLRSADQVALVLAVLVVRDDDELPRPDVRDPLLYVAVQHSCLTYFPMTSPST